VAPAYAVIDPLKSSAVQAGYNEIGESAAATFTSNTSSAMQHRSTTSIPFVKIGRPNADAVTPIKKDQNFAHQLSFFFEHVAGSAESALIGQNNIRANSYML
jgi:hypothetical protein